MESDSYDAVSVQGQKRFCNGNSFTIQYTRSRLRDKLNYLNPADGELEDRVSPNDRPNRLSIGASYRLPFGHDEKWGASWNTLVNGFLGGWQVSGTYQYQTGFPLTFGNLYQDPNRDPKDLVSDIGKHVAGGVAGLDVPAWDISGFYFDDAAAQAVGPRNDPRIQLGNNVRYFPSTLPDVRTDNLHLMDLGFYKNFSLPHNSRLQVRVEAINALNYAVLWNPDVNPRNATFGFINQDRNNPRDIQLGLRFTF